jgi:hypothetical protein
MANDNRVPLMGLYEQTSARGTKYLRGKLGRAMVWVFKNDRKTKDTDPDYTIYLSPDNRDQAQQSSGQPAAQPRYPARSSGFDGGTQASRPRSSESSERPASASEPAPWEQGSGGSDDIPF